MALDDPFGALLRHCGRQAVGASSSGFALVSRCGWRISAIPFAGLLLDGVDGCDLAPLVLLKLEELVPCVGHVVPLSVADEGAEPVAEEGQGVLASAALCKVVDDRLSPIIGAYTAGPQIGLVRLAGPRVSIDWPMASPRSKRPS